ncbi:WhiB family transcriptional regulator [Streptomyces sp. NRRL F-5135]|uniref:WhiB family transcriptional regulator n=1 Tax=Streptomyces sp. NRRL F-5135 TaxID=1463858 RepID=UPI00069202CD|nr:WhiB family transcriptional regulator [Streptomyces sp. NRRL F-5135]
MTMSLSPSAAHQALTEHPLYRYRGCQPDVDNPRMAAGDPDVPVDAWGPWTGDGAEPQADRYARERAAKSVCGFCPVREACRIYANTETADGMLAEPEGVWGGELALERHRALIQRRKAALDAGRPVPVVEVRRPERDLAMCRTVQKQAVLRSLARETDEELVAYRAGMDVRTANWNRSALCKLLGVDRETATREDLLDAARRHGVLPRGVRVRPDGAWPVAAAPTTDGMRQRRIGPGRPVQLMIPDFPPLPLSPAGARPRAASGCGGPPGRVPARAAGSGGGPVRLRLVIPPPEPLALPLSIPDRLLETAS